MFCTVSKLRLIICKTFARDRMALNFKALTGGEELQHVTARNSSGDEIANVNFRTDNIVHALQNSIDSYMISPEDQCRCVGTQVYQSQ